MKSKAMFLMIVSAIFFFMANSAQAALLHLSAGIPIQYNFNDSDIKSESVSGSLLHVSIPLLPGVGIENYEIKLKDDVLTDAKVKVLMYDIFYMLPIPMVNVTLGAGMGKAEMDCSGCSSLYDSSFGNTTQFYGQIGYPIAGVFDIHFSYHNVRSEIDTKSSAPSGTEKIKSAGSMYALGVAFTF